MNPDMIAKLHVDTTTAAALAAGEYVSVGLWNTCSIRGDNHSCGTPSISFVFDPVALWSDGGSDSPATVVLPPQLVSDLKSHSISTRTYKALLLSGASLTFMSVLFWCISPCTGQRTRRTLATVIMWDSLLATLLVTVAAALITQPFEALKDSLGPSFGNIITFSLGKGAFALLWASAVFGFLAAVFSILAWRHEKRLDRVGRGFVEININMGKKWQADAYNTVVVEGTPSEEVRGRDNAAHPLLDRDTEYKSHMGH